MIRHGIRVSFEHARIEVSTVLRSVAIAASPIARDKVAMALVARYAAKILQQEVEESVNGLVLCPPSPLPSGSDSYSNEARKSCENRKSQKKLGRRKSFVLSSDKKNVVLERITEGSDKIDRVVYH